jgi:shikimate dehydrogenase
MYPFQRIELNSQLSLVLDNVQGLNVTHPFKSVIPDYIFSLEKTAKMIGAVNTLFRKQHNWCGANTDWKGFQYLLQRNRIEASGRTIYIIGTGGAARAVLYALHTLKIPKIIIFYHTKHNIRAVQRIIHTMYSTSSLDYIPLKSQTFIKFKSHSLVIQATPVGMFPHIDELPVQVPDLFRDVIFIDLIYNPLITKCMEQFSLGGAQVFNGLDMLIAQGFESLKLWVDLKYSYNPYHEKIFKILEGKIECLQD